MERLFSWEQVENTRDMTRHRLTVVTPTADGRIVVVRDTRFEALHAAREALDGLLIAFREAETHDR